MTKRATIENAELTLTLDDVAYKFEYVSSLNINDPRENALSISPQGTGDGIPYRNNTTQPVTADMVVRDLPAALFAALKVAFEEQERIDMLLFDKIIGDQYTLDNAILAGNPSNLGSIEGEAAFDVTVNVRCSANNFEHKPPADT